MPRLKPSLQKFRTILFCVSNPLNTAFHTYSKPSEYRFKLINPEMFKKPMFPCRPFKIMAFERSVRITRAMPTKKPNRQHVFVISRCHVFWIARNKVVD